jgi:threonine dehydratase
MVSFDDIARAHERIKPHAERTPFLTSTTVDALTGAKVFFKCENFQRMGAFKFRGAFNALSQLKEPERKRGVVAFSSGNHAQAVALAGRMLGINTVIVMPEDAPKVKLDATRGYGAEVVQYAKSQAREELAGKLASERGLTLIPPFDHEHIIAGQGTVGLEILEQRPDVTMILVPVSGGGLISGISIAVESLRPEVELIAVEPAGAPKLTVALAAGEPQTLDQTQSIADGLLARSIGKFTFPILSRVVRTAVRVSESDIAGAVRFLHHEAGLVSEPSGAVGVAALLAGLVRPAGPTVVVLSGGNVDPDLYQRLVG